MTEEHTAHTTHDWNVIGLALLIGLCGVYSLWKGMLLWALYFFVGGYLTWAALSTIDAAKPTKARDNGE